MRYILYEQNTGDQEPLGFAYAFFFLSKRTTEDDILKFINSHKQGTDIYFMGFDTYRKMSVVVVFVKYLYSRDDFGVQVHQTLSPAEMSFISDFENSKLLKKDHGGKSFSVITTTMTVDDFKREGLSTYGLKPHLSIRGIID